MAQEAARLFSADYGLSVTGYAAAVPEKNIRRPFAYFSIYGEGRTLITQRIEAPERSKLEKELAARWRMLETSAALKKTIEALRVQLWFTQQVLVELLGLLIEKE